MEWVSTILDHLNEFMIFYTTKYKSQDHIEIINIQNVTKDYWITHKKHCAKSVRIRSYCGLYFPVFGLNTDQNNSKYGPFSRSEKCFKLF